MDHALCKIKSTGKWKLVFIDEIKSGKISISEIAGNIVCPYCGELGCFKHKDLREWHFAFEHKDYCDVVKDDSVKHKTHVVVTGEIVHEEDILHKNIYRKTLITKYLNLEDADIEDCDIASEDCELVDIDYDKQKDSQLPRKQIDDIDMVKLFKKSNIYRPLGLYKLILKVGIFEPIFDDGRCGNDVLLDDIHLKKIRDVGMDDSKRLAIVKRTGTKLLKHPFQIPRGYSLLRDIYAIDREKSIFFLVKVTHEELNKVFQIELMGDRDNRNKTRNKHRDLLIYADWRKYPNDFYQIYMADIGNCAYSFVDMAYDRKK